MMSKVKAATAVAGELPKGAVSLSGQARSMAPSTPADPMARSRLDRVLQVRRRLEHENGGEGAREAWFEVSRYPGLRFTLYDVAQLVQAEGDAIEYRRLPPRKIAA